MSCYSKHPDIPGVDCWHGPGHAGNHGKENRSWPNVEDPVQIELAALRKVAAAAQEASHYCDCCCARCIALEDAIATLREAGR